MSLIAAKRKVYASNEKARKRFEFWESVWSMAEFQILRDALREFHAETVRMILRMGSTSPGRYAKRHVLADEGCPRSFVLSDQVHRYLGDSAATNNFFARGAGVAVLYARRYAYCAAAFDPKWDGMRDYEVKTYFRECSARSEWDLLEAIETTAKHRGVVLDLGRPE